MAAAPSTIVLLPAEQLLCELLLECAQNRPGLDIWITGGWVRDRLLGIPSSDLDFALSNMTGRAFGSLLQEFSARPNIEAKYRQRAVDLGIPASESRFTRFHIMEKDAGAAKHLETAGGRLFGLEVDLANLRKEVYDGQSRNPQMEFGSPEEDALRRDATVNSLFYHLRTQQVVDLTGRGLADLKARIMRTPLDPRQTFMDDPLRVLRLIRIGSKLDFAIDTEAMRYMRDDEIRGALDTMIKRDRINTEVFKMMRFSGTVTAFQHLFDANLYTPVFLRLDSPLVQSLQASFPTSLGQPQAATPSAPWPSPWPHAYRLLHYLLYTDTGSDNPLSNLHHLVQSSPHDHDASHLWTMAAYAPVAGAGTDGSRQQQSSSRSTTPLNVKQAAQEATAALKLPSKLTKLLEAALTNCASIQARVHDVAELAQVHAQQSRSTVGMAIRAWGASWQAQVVYALLAEVVYSHSGNDGRDDDDAYGVLFGPVVRKYAAFADLVSCEGLWNAHALRPCLDGNEVMKLLGLRTGGRFLKDVLDGLVAWQFDHPYAGVEEAEVWVREERGRLGVPSGPPRG